MSKQYFYSERRYPSRARSKRYMQTREGESGGGSVVVGTNLSGMKGVTDHSELGGIVSSADEYSDFARDIHLTAASADTLERLSTLEVIGSTDSLSELTEQNVYSALRSEVEDGKKLDKISLSKQTVKGSVCFEKDVEAGHVAVAGAVSSGSLSVAGNVNVGTHVYVGNMLYTTYIRGNYAGAASDVMNCSATQTNLGQITGRTFLRSGDMDLFHVKNGINHAIWDAGNFNPDSKIDHNGKIIATNFPDHQMGYGFATEGWSMTGPAVAFGSGKYSCQMQMDIGMGSDFKFRSVYNNEARPWNKFWHSGNSNLSTVDWIAKNLSADTIVIRNTEAVGHIKFSRANANYFTTPTNGYFSFIPGGKAINIENATAVIGEGYLYPGKTNTYLLGTNGYRWSNVYSVFGDFSGSINVANSLIFNGGNYIMSDNSAYVGFLTSGNAACPIAAGGLTVSDHYRDVSKKPIHGIYSKGGLLYDGNITTSSFIPGFSGSGASILNSGGKYTATFDNLVVRGTFSVYELIVNQINSANGSLWVSDHGEIESISGSVITLKGNNNNMNPFRVNDLVICQKFTGSSVKRYVCRVSAVSALTITVVYVTGGTGGNMAAIGDTLVRRGSTSDTTRQGALYLTASDSGAPYMDVIDGVNSDSLADKTKVRVGKLDGITDPVFGSLSGYGLYSANAYLTGGINASFGKIGGFNINSTTIYAGDLYPGGGIQMKKEGNAGRFMVSNSNAHYVMLYNYDDSSWGLIGNINGLSLFQLGSTNQIAGWHFTTKGLYSGNIEITASGSIRHIGEAWRFDNAGSGRLASGNIVWDASGNVTFSPAVKLIWQADINSTIGNKLTKIDAYGIYTGTLTAAQVNAVGIHANSITTGTLSADRIAANSLNANKIIARTITADRIAAGVITSNELNVNDLKANVINASYISSLEITTNKLTALNSCKLGDFTIIGGSFYSSYGTSGNISMISLNKDSILFTNNNIIAGLGTSSASSTSGIDVPLWIENNQKNVDTHSYAAFFSAKGAINRINNIAIALGAGCISGLAVKVTPMDVSGTIRHGDVFVPLYNKSVINVNLPANPEVGKIVLIKLMNNIAAILYGNGKQLAFNTTYSSFRLDTWGAMYICIYDGQYWCMQKITW